jgi:N utilization substance protein B
LFGLDFTQYDWEQAIGEYWVVNQTRASVKDYAELLIRGVMAERIALDTEIDSALDHWSPDRVGHVERNVLRLALYEMRHAEDVPQAVAINEAIEVTKRYGSDEAPGFVNGVLDKLKTD